MYCTEGRKTKLMCTVQEEGKLSSLALYTVQCTEGRKTEIMCTVQEEGEVRSSVLYRMKEK